MEDHSRQELSSVLAYLRVVRQRIWIVLFITVVVPVGALLLSLRQPAQYAASSDVLLSRQNLGAALSGAPDLTLATDLNLVATQAQIAHTNDVAQLALTIAKRTDVTPAQLLGETQIVTSSTSDILGFRVTDHDPERAKLLAASFAQAYVDYLTRVNTKSLVKARSDVAKVLAQLRLQGREKSNLYTSLEEKEQQLQTLQTLQTSEASVIGSATQAVQVSPRPVRDALLGAALGLVLGVGLAFGIDALDTRVRSDTEIGEWLNLPLLARVPRPPKGIAKKDHLAMLVQPTSRSAEAFRMLRTNLDFARLEDRDLRVIVVTSAIESEGKSTTAANLALAEALAGRHVCLVDLDLRSPSIDRFFELPHPLFESPRAWGITNVALGHIELTEALRRVDLTMGGAALNAHTVPRERDGHGEHGSLDVLEAGPLPPDPGEFVSRKRVARILANLRDAYDLVIVDTSPMLRVGDAMKLSTHADGLLVITRLNVLRRPMLRELRRQLESAPAPKLGFVVTGVGDDEAAGLGYDTKKRRVATIAALAAEEVER